MEARESRTKTMLMALAKLRQAHARVLTDSEELE